MPVGPRRDACMKWRAMKPARSSGANSSASVRPCNSSGTMSSKVVADCDAKRITRSASTATIKSVLCSASTRKRCRASALRRSASASGTSTSRRPSARFIDTVRGGSPLGIAPRGRTADQQVALGIGHVQRDAEPGQQLGKGFELGVGHDGLLAVAARTLDIKAVAAKREHRSVFAAHRSSLRSRGQMCRSVSGGRARVRRTPTAWDLRANTGHLTRTRRFAPHSRPVVRCNPSHTGGRDDTSSHCPLRSALRVCVARLRHAPDPVSHAARA